MSFYWRSPYLSRSTGEMETDRSDVTPRVTRSAAGSRGLSDRGLSDHVSPQDWFDSTMPSAKNTSPTVFRRAGTQIKGILKTTQEKTTSQKHKVYRNNEISEDSSNETGDKKEKKKVTFDPKDKPTSKSQNSAVALTRGVSANQLRIQLSQPFNELTKQNLKKLLGFTSASLPPVSGKSIIPRNGDRPKSSSAICKHVSDLKCANCLPDSQRKISLKLEVFSPRRETPEEAAEKLVNGSADPELSIGLKRYPSPTDRSGGKHWTSSFVKPGEKRKQSRHVPGRYPFSAGTTPRQLNELMQKVDQRSSVSAAQVRDSLKLQVTGGNNGYTNNPVTTGQGQSGHDSPGADDDVEQVTPGLATDVTGAFVPPGSARSDRTGNRGVRGYKIPATHLLNQSAVTYLRKPATAHALRTRPGQTGLELQNRGDNLLSRERDQYNLDKTQQILSWLQDVKQKDGYRPRHARLYALETQQTH